MRLDVTCMRYLSKDEYRVLTAVEQGMRNHELVPIELITSIAKLRHGGIIKILSTLLRYKLLAHEQHQYNGYRLSYLGYDILALRTLLSRGIITAVGSQIGVGKESDIFEAQSSTNQEIVIKIHRLGRTSFRSVRKTRDYMLNKSKASWLYMSRLAAIKEYAFMQALYQRNFPTPQPIDQNRHIVVMSRIHGYPLAQIQGSSLTNIPFLFLQSIQILKRLVYYGLIHCDYNEFNLMIASSTSDEENEPTLPLPPAPSHSLTSPPLPPFPPFHPNSDSTTTPTTMTTAVGVEQSSVPSTPSQIDHLIMIDFPQIISINHLNASELFQRDLNGVIRYFTHKLKYSLEDREEDNDQTTPPIPRSEEEQRIRQMIIEELIGRDGEIIKLEEIIEMQQKERKEKERKEREQNQQKGVEQEQEEDIFEEIKRRQHHGGMSHDDDRILIEYLAHNREHKEEMMKEMNKDEDEDEGDNENENDGGEGSGDEIDGRDAQLLNENGEIENDEEEGNSEEEEGTPLRSQDEIRNALRRNITKKHDTKQGSRNSTKKRNKYGKVERINIKHEW